MRSHFDPEFSFQSSRSIIPIFAEHISLWVDKLPRHSSTEQQPKHKDLTRNVMNECRLLAFRLIAVSMYGEAFNENVSTKVSIIVGRGAKVE